MFAPREMNFRGTELFPDVMQPPPVVRLTVIVDHFVDDGLLRNHAINIIQNTKGTIMGFWNGQRQNHMLAGLTRWQKSLLIPTFGATLLMTYVGAQGMNEMWLKLNLSEYAYSVPGGDDPLCALVLYSDHKVAAIRMDKLAGGAPIYKAVLKKSSWGDELLPTSQLKLNKKYSVVYAPIEIDKNVISKVNHYSLTTTSTQPANSLQHFAAGFEKIAWTDVPRDVSGVRPILNGSGNTYYSPTATFTVGKDGITAEQTADMQTVDENLGRPNVITADGTYYYGTYAAGHGGEAAFFGTTTEGRYGAPPTAITVPPFAGIAYYTTKTQIFESHTEVVYDFGGSFVPYSFAHELPFMVFSQSGGLDHLDVVFKNVSVSGQLSPLLDADEATLNGVPISFSGHVPTGAGQLNPLVFPYSFGTSTSNMWWLFDDYPTLKSALHTPHGKIFTFNDNIPGRSVWPVYFVDNYVMTSWMHVSNGKNVMQGIKYMDHQYLWLNSREWAPAKIDVDTIQTVILDVPLSRITKLK